jgi:hypothetical protein
MRIAVVRHGLSRTKRREGRGISDFLKDLGRCGINRLSQLAPAAGDLPVSQCSHHYPFALHLAGLDRSTASAEHSANVHGASQCFRAVVRPDLLLGNTVDLGAVISKKVLHGLKP